MSWPTCTNCHHGWHGLPCPAAHCNCATAFDPVNLED